MRLTAFRIRNFKSIIDTKECKLSQEDNILVLTGQNEAGKSSILEGLDFFRNGPDEDFERLHRRRDEHPQVNCTFRLSESDIDNVFIESSEFTELKKYLQKNPEITFIRGNTEEDDFDDVGICEEDWDKLSKVFESRDESKKVQAIRASAPGEEAKAAEQTSEEESYELEDLQKFLIPEIRPFTLFTSFKDLLPGVVKVADIKKHPAIKDFETVFGVNFSEVVEWEPRNISREEDRIRKAATTNFNQYWKQTLEEGDEYNFSVKITAKKPAPESEIEFRIDRNDGDPLYMEHKSQGFKWFSAFNLRLRALGEEKAMIENLVILIDEPGQGLHERGQLNVKNVLEELAEKGAQIIYSTHYPNLIGTEGKEFARIRLVSNSLQAGTRIDDPAQFASRAGSKDALMPLVKAMGLVSIHSLLDSESFNVIVEGIADHYYFSGLKKLLEKNPRLYFVPSCGAGQALNITKIFIGWRLNFRTIVDDEKEGRKTYNDLKNGLFEKSDELAHEHVYKLKDMKGVEDLFSRADFFKHVLDKPLDKNEKRANSELAEGKKELLGRLFLEKAESGSMSLSRETLDNFKAVFDWLYKGFGIS